MQYRVVRIVLVLAGAMLLASCASQPSISADGPGFFSGLWHGLTIAFSLVGSMFSDVRIYESPNGGFFYDLGFTIGVAAFFSSSHTL